MKLKMALPKGRLLAPTAALLERAGWGLDGYSDKARLYRLKSRVFPGLQAKMFQEKDIPIQVAIGNYDLGICGLDWIQEQLVKYPSSAIIRLKNLGFGEGAIYAAICTDALRGNQLITRDETVRLASEYPNLAESLAQKLRLKRFSVYPLWGAAEAYPAENAEIVLLFCKNEEELAGRGMRSLGKVVDFKAFLIANKESLKSKDMSALLTSINEHLQQTVEYLSDDYAPHLSFLTQRVVPQAVDSSTVRLALPDGHQQVHVRRILDAVGISLDDYPSSTGNRRPKSSLEGFSVKVIRPQDMPLQVANGNFDLAVTGRDWLTDHLYQFPASPVRELIDFKYGRVRIVAVVADEVQVSTTEELRALRQNRDTPCRVAAEYVNIADDFARVNHLGAYRIIPTWGATEAFLPEDADLLIENTETGSTIVRHNLKIIETLFESTACLIGGTTLEPNQVKRERMESFVSLLKRAVAALT